MVVYQKKVDTLSGILNSFDRELKSVEKPRKDLSAISTQNESQNAASPNILLNGGKKRKRVILSDEDETPKMKQKKSNSAVESELNETIGNRIKAAKRRLVPIVEFNPSKSIS